MGQAMDTVYITHAELAVGSVRHTPHLPSGDMEEIPLVDMDANRVPLLGYPIDFNPKE